MRDVVIGTAVRTALGKAPAGSLHTVRPDDIAALVLRGALARLPSLDPAGVDDVIMGCAMPEAEQGLNVARIASLRAGLPVTVPAMTVSRFCASGLESVIIAADRIAAGRADIIVAGGVESMSLIPMGGHVVAPNPELAVSYPDVYLTTGLVAEGHARESGISRDAQDEYAFRSHTRAIRALDHGAFRDEIVPVPVSQVSPRPGGGLDAQTFVFDVDEGPRRDTSISALAKLKPSFAAGGTVTAGNASQMSDGAAALVLMSAEAAATHHITPLARFVTYATVGVAPERFGIGPVPAVRAALRRAGLTLEQIDIVELNEAFAAQVLACQAELHVPEDRLNVNGGAIALGHPLGCTGARLTTSLIYELARRHGRYGVVTLCVGGGMGSAAVFERL